jgi:hypothetical protein
MVDLPAPQPQQDEIAQLDVCLNIFRLQGGVKQTIGSSSRDISVTLLVLFLRLKVAVFFILVFGTL